VPAPAPAPVLHVGDKGLVMVQYNGEYNAKWKGPVTQTLYPFDHAQRKYGYLDTRDWDGGMSSIKNADGSAMFFEVYG